MLTQSPVIRGRIILSAVRVRLLLPLSLSLLPFSHIPFEPFSLLFILLLFFLFVGGTILACIELAL